MSKLDLYLFTEPILHKPTELVKTIDSEIVEAVSDMLFIMNKNTGVGLSANQAGLSKRFCVVNLKNGTLPLVLINPKIIEKSKEKIKLDEGCLSAPRIWLPMKRYKTIRIVCLSLKGEECEYEMTDLDARIVQHECDHLDGKMITDHLIKTK